MVYVIILAAVKLMTVVVNNSLSTMSLVIVNVQLFVFVISAGDSGDVVLNFVMSALLSDEVSDTNFSSSHNCIYVC